MGPPGAPFRLRSRAKSPPWAALQIFFYCFKNELGIYATKLVKKEMNSGTTGGKVPILGTLARTIILFNAKVGTFHRVTLYYHHSSLASLLFIIRWIPKILKY